MFVTCLWVKASKCYLITALAVHLTVILHIEVLYIDFVVNNCT